LCIWLKLSVFYNFNPSASGLVPTSLSEPPQFKVSSLKSIEYEAAYSAEYTIQSKTEILRSACFHWNTFKMGKGNRKTQKTGSCIIVQSDLVRWCMIDIF